MLYAADMRSVAPAVVLREVQAEREAAHGAMNDYTAELVVGVGEHRSRIDELIATYSQGWEIDRMPAIDRNVLRIGIFEVLWGADVPDGVAVSEAVELVAEISTDESPKFINGVLGRVVEMKPMLPEGSSGTA